MAVISQKSTFVAGFAKIVSSIFLVFTLASNPVISQESFTLYHMTPIPQSQYTNLSAQPLHMVNVGFPGLSGIQLGVSNSGFKYSDLIKRDGDSLRLDMDGVLEKLSDLNYLSMGLNLDLISVGVKFKSRTFVQFAARERLNFQLRYPKDLIDFAWNGNGPSLGQEMNFNLGLELSHYRSYGIAVNQEIGKKFCIAAGIKYLYGMENIHTARSNVSLTTNPGDYALTAQSDILINTAGVSDTSFKNFNVKNYLFKKNNTGMAYDFGISYKPTEALNLSFSAIDIGSITWNDNIKNFQSRNPDGKYTFSGVNLGNLINDSTSINSAFNQTLDTIYNNFRIDSNYTAYKTKLSPQFYLGASYKINPTFTPGILFYSQYFDSQHHPAVSLSMNTHLTRRWHLSASYTAFNKSYNNIGLGTSLNSWGGTQFYLVCDNVLGMIFPQNTKVTNFRFGINLRFGVDPYRDDEDNDGIPDDMDKCPRVAGFPELQGCPDKDGDKVTDNEDNCPDEPGQMKLQGCPDKDDDGVIDKFDGCPEIPGGAETKGCPDKDKDGVLDENDKCPDIKGSPESQGCPDTDGDGVVDAMDRCPDSFGPAEKQGCPDDADGDGVGDMEDSCPTEPGSKSNQGCPDKDSDSDGVMDSQDKCPQIAGSILTSGCPEFEAALKDLFSQSVSEIKFLEQKADLIGGSVDYLDRVVAELKKNPMLKIKIESHVGIYGTDSFNNDLSKDRGNSVVDFLKSRDIDPFRIRLESFGASKPIATQNDSLDNKTANDRVILVPEY